jgi:hypothetical protein
MVDAQLTISTAHDGWCANLPAGMKRCEGETRKMIVKRRTDSNADSHARVQS